MKGVGMQEWRSGVVAACLLLGVASAKAGEFEYQNVGVTSYPFEKTVPAERDTELQVHLDGGFLLVQTWDRDEVQVLGDEGGGEIDVKGGPTRIYVGGAKDPRCKNCDYGSVEMEIHMPEWMDLRVRATHADVELENLRANVDVELVDGDVLVVGGRGRIDLTTVHGEVKLHGAEGDVTIIAPNDDVEIRDCAGPVYVETVNGDTRMEGIRSDRVEVVTTNGDILYDGTLNPVGVYAFSSHAGDVALSVPPDADLSVRLITYEGELDQNLGLNLKPLSPGKPLDFEMGEGTGRLRVETFKGDILLFDPKRGRSKRG